MRVNVISFNRQHLLDLSRGLIGNGCDTMFYTMVPQWRCKRFGLSGRYCSSSFFRFAPEFVYNKLCKGKHIARLQMKFGKWVLNNMRDCDVIIINGYGLCFLADDYEMMRRKFNAIIVMEWGSKHIIEERKAINAIDTYPREFYDLQLSLYDAADIISIPAEHVRRSFLMHGIPENKLFINPYGANLNIFRPTSLTSQHYELIMTGTWSKRKGCDIITILCEKYGYNFLHVGHIGDIPFPNDIPSMHHVDAVDEKRLPDFYAKAKVFILLSRTEGLALVQAQAMACGLPLVCSRNTGGIDLARLLNCEDFVFEAQNDDIKTINFCVQKALNVADRQSSLRRISNSIDRLSWDRYGKQYVEFLNKMIKTR